MVDDDIDPDPRRGVPVEATGDVEAVTAADLPHDSRERQARRIAAPRGTIPTYPSAAHTAGLNRGSLGRCRRASMPGGSPRLDWEHLLATLLEVDRGPGVRAAAFHAALAASIASVAWRSREAYSRMHASRRARTGDQATQWPADLIVCCTHGRRGIRRLLLGSDSEYVVRHAPVPVLLVPAK